MQTLVELSMFRMLTLQVTVLSLVHVDQNRIVSFNSLVRICPGINVHLVFKNNYADTAGSVLYGVAVDNCKLTHGLDSNSSGEVFDKMVHIDNDTEYSTTSTISSDPLQICPCENNLDCSVSWYIIPRTVYLGETFQVSLVAVGQRGGTVPSTVGECYRQYTESWYYASTLTIPSTRKQHLHQTELHCVVTA